MSIYQLFATGSTSADSVASLDIQFPGHIIGFSFSGNGASMATADDSYTFEASFLSSNCFISNDCRGVIGRVDCRVSGTSGQADAKNSLSGLSIPVSAGERVHLHRSIGGGTGATVMSCILYVEDAADPTLRRRR